MTFPKSFRMAGNRWRVIITKRRASEYGSCDAATHTIGINTLVGDEYVSEQTMLKTFLHEWWHAYEATTGRTYSETDAVQFEEMMYQTLSTMKGVA